ncbi:unnamed protein product [Clavelina lepadiformis]|uniref:Uncharacterized protein n=2 Tax=Clavelina lepadiformis TaxID=159417 RepID=A0ABP0FUR9_CLALP
MKAAEIRTVSGYEAIKAKTLQFPPGTLENKTNVRANANSNTFDVSTPPLFSLRFLNSVSSAELLKSRSKSRVSVAPDVTKEDNHKRLPPVELTINKKIKFPHGKRLTDKERNGFSQLISSDRVILEELRQQLRTQPPNGTTSVLEAIADPQVRQERFYYEPLKTFKQDKSQIKDCFVADTRVRVVNIMIPENEHTIGTDILLPLTISRQQAAATRNTNRVRGGASTAFSFLPQVVGSSLEKKSHVQQDSSKYLKDIYQLDLENLGKLNLQMVSDENKPAGFGSLPRKSQVNLPQISLKRDDYELEESQIRWKKRKVLEPGQPARPAATVQLPSRRDKESISISNSFPRRATTTANGKAHLIGPMNKMEMIADYSKALQSGVISYNEYMKKLSVLSLHRVTLPNSAQRQFHIIRDQTNNMKPTLTHVEMKPNTNFHTLPPEQRELDVIRRPSMPNDKVKRYHQTRKARSNEQAAIEDSKNISDKSDPPQLHKVDIGEGLTLFDESQPMMSDSNGDVIITTDLTRYTHVHHPRLGRQAHYHWNHDVLNTSHDSRSGRRGYHWQKAGSENRDWANHFDSQKNPTRKSDLKPLENNETDNNNKQVPALLSLEDHLKGIATENIANRLRSSQKNSLGFISQFEKEALAALNSDDILSVKSPANQVGKIPYPVSEAEQIGFASSDVIGDMTLKVPLGPLAEDTDADDVSDVDSVFQPHLKNMLKTIKKAKANKKRKVPELRGLVPTVVPKLRVEASEKRDAELKGTEGDRNKTTNEITANANFLEINKQLPENTPPPTAEKAQNLFVEGSQQPGIREVTHSAGNTLNVVSPTRTNLKIVIDKANSQLILNQASSGSPISQRRRTPASKKENLEMVEPPPPENNTEIRIMTASVDLVAPSDDDEKDGGMSDRSRLEVVITSMPAAPPASIATSSEGEQTDVDVE